MKEKKDNTGMTIMCDNLKEFFAEFTKYRNSISENEWEQEFNKFYKKESKSHFFEDYEENKIVIFPFKYYDNKLKDYGQKVQGGRLKLEISVDLKHDKWQIQKEKITQILTKIWETKKFKDNCNLDLDWSTVYQPDNKNKKEQEKEIIKKALRESPQIASSLTQAKKQFKLHVGYEEEKKKFGDYIKLYLATNGEFCPDKEIICYVGAPGMGKTTFIQNLNKAMGRGKIQIVSCAGLKKFKKYSILGEKNKPSLVAWAIKENGYKNPIILLDELEKIEDEQIQRDLVKLFNLYKNREGAKKKDYHSKKLFDKYYQMDIELDHITFFATVNYPQDLVPLLKNEVAMRSLKKYTIKEKEVILRLKKAEIEANIEKIYGEKKEIIPEEIIIELPKYIKEAGIRQAERALRKIEKDYINARENNQSFSLKAPKTWLKKNALYYQENFYLKPKHKWLLFPLWVIDWAFILTIVIKKIILKRRNNKVD